MEPSKEQIRRFFFEKLPDEAQQVVVSADIFDKLEHGYEKYQLPGEQRRVIGPLVGRVLMGIIKPNHLRIALKRRLPEMPESVAEQFANYLNDVVFEPHQEALDQARETAEKQQLMLGKKKVAKLPEATPEERADPFASLEEEKVGSSENEEGVSEQAPSPKQQEQTKQQKETAEFGPEKKEITGDTPHEPPPAPPRSSTREDHKTTASDITIDRLGEETDPEQKPSPKEKQVMADTPPEPPGAPSQEKTSPTEIEKTPQEEREGKSEQAPGQPTTKSDPEETSPQKESGSEATQEKNEPPPAPTSKEKEEGHPAQKPDKDGISQDEKEDQPEPLKKEGVSSEKESGQLDHRQTEGGEEEEVTFVPETSSKQGPVRDSINNNRSGIEKETGKENKEKNEKTPALAADISSEEEIIFTPEPDPEPDIMSEDLFLPEEIIFAPETQEPARQKTLSDTDRSSEEKPSPDKQDKKPSEPQSLQEKIAAEREQNDSPSTPGSQKNSPRSLRDKIKKKEETGQRKTPSREDILKGIEQPETAASTDRETLKNTTG